MLVEVMICSAIGSFILAALLAIFTFLGRSSMSLCHYVDMEAQARVTLQRFSEDARMASRIACQTARG